MSRHDVPEQILRTPWSPGPWCVSPVGDDSGDLRVSTVAGVLDGHRLDVATVHLIDNAGWDERVVGRDSANAWLIALAPRLARALRLASHIVPKDLPGEDAREFWHAIEALDAMEFDHGRS